MTINPAPDFEKITKQSEILLSGQYNSVFNDQILNLSHQFYALSRPDFMAGMFYDVFKSLESARKTNNSWNFDEVIKIIAPDYKSKNFASTLDFLVNTCKIPEGHINFGNEYANLVPGEIFPVTARPIYLSRYAMCLLTKKVMLKSKSFKTDADTELLAKPSEEHLEKSKKDFEHGICASFAGHYFIMPDSECGEIIDTMWTRIRGQRLKTYYEYSMKKFANIALKYKATEFEFNKKNPSKFYGNLEKFKQKFIFDILFKDHKNGSFQAQYEDAIKSFGYKQIKDKDGKYKWKKHRRSDAPKFPGAFFAPHIGFLMGWLMNAFCEFVNTQEETGQMADKSKWFDLITKNFFNVVRDGMFAAAQSNQNKKYKFQDAPLFVNEHHSDAMDASNAIKDGAGRRKTDKKTGDTFREIPGAIDAYKNQTLFDDDINFCLQLRKSAEIKLAQLHQEYLIKPSSKLAAQIHTAEQKIIFENNAIYGFNFQAFVKIPETLGRDGMFSSRPVIGADKALTDFYIPKNINIPQIIQSDDQSIQTKIQFKEMKIWESPKYKSVEFVTLPKSKILVPDGHAVTSEKCVNYKGKQYDDWYLSESGIYMSVNPLKENPTAFRIKNGNTIPSLVIENFQMCNYLIESDTLPPKEQENLAKYFIDKNATNLVVESGRRSHHIRISVKDVPNTPDEYTWLFYYICTKHGLATRTWNAEKMKYIYTGDVDLACRNPNRNMRRPSMIRTLEDGRRVEQKLLHRTNVIYDIDWRPVYEQETCQMRLLQQRNPKIIYLYEDNKNINSFMENYANKNCISLSFATGTGHDTGCIIIGAAKRAGFSGTDIDNWLRINCDRYNELIGSWHSLLKTNLQYQY